MILKKVQLTNFRCFNNICVELHPRLNVFVGKNGQGKTALLEGIAVGLTELLKFVLEIDKADGVNFHENDLREKITTSSKYFKHYQPLNKAPYMRVTLESTGNITWDCTKQRDKTERTKKETPPGKKVCELRSFLENIVNDIQEGKSTDMPVIAFYGIDRINNKDIPINQQYHFLKNFNRFKALEGSLTANRHCFEKITEWFAIQEDLERRERENQSGYVLPVLQSVRHAINQIVPKCSNPHTVINPIDLSVTFFVTMEYQAGHTEVLPFNRLSDGYRTMLAFIIDLARRMAQANPHLDDPLQSEAIVLIDEIDLHLHPDWQQIILPNLLQTFTKTQFLVTTHSPQVLTTIQKENIHILEWDLENGINVSQQLTNTYGAESSRLLEEVFKVSSRPNNLAEVQQLKEYLRLVDHGKYDTKSALNLRNKLENVFHGGDSALQLADMVIRKHKVLDIHKHKALDK
jgi:predicted ATP-binding protein involved in virulence